MTRSCPVHAGHARHGGANSGGTETCELRLRPYGATAKEGGHGAHLDGAEGDLELSRRREDVDAVDEEEAVPAAELDVAGPIDGAGLQSARGKQMRRDAGAHTRSIAAEGAKTAAD